MTSVQFSNTSDTTSNPSNSNDLMRSVAFSNTSDTTSNPSNSDDLMRSVAFSNTSDTTSNPTNSNGLMRSVTFSNTSDTTSNPANSSDLMLSRINDARADDLIPAMAVIGLYILIGGVGNSLVCYVIGLKLKMNTQNLLIVSLAVMDLLCCMVSIPTDIVDMRYSYLFPSETMCKILRFVMHFTSIGSGMILIVIAMDRYRKICQPLKTQIELRQAKISVAVVLFIDIALCWPTLIIFGFRSIDTGIPGLQGHDCSTSEAIKDTVFPLAFAVFLFLFFLTSGCFLVVLYCYILISIKRHRRRMVSRSLSVEQPRLGKTSGSFHFPASGSSGSDNSQDKAEELLNLGSAAKSLLPHPERPRDSEDVSNSSQCKDVLNRPSPSLDKGLSMVPKTESIYSLGAYDSDYSCGVGVPRHQRQLHTVGNSEDVIDFEDFSQQIQIKGDTVLYFNVSHDSGKSAYNNSMDVKRGIQDPEQIISRSKSWDKLEQMTDNAKNTSQISTITINDQTKEQKNHISTTTNKIEQKTTLIASLVTLVFILSYLPYLSLQVGKIAIDGLDYERQGTALVFYNIFLRSYYINSIANPVIYGILNIRFQQAVRGLLRRGKQMLCHLCGRESQ